MYGSTGAELDVGETVAEAGGGVGEFVGFGIVLAGNAADGELKGAGELAADPVERIEAGAAAGIFAAHLADDDVGIGIDAERLGFPVEGALERFEEGDVFGDIIVLPADPLGDESAAAGGVFDNDANAGRPRAAVGAAIDVGYQL
jgi:hypothetical protein